MTDRAGDTGTALGQAADELFGPGLRMAFDGDQARAPGLGAVRRLPALVASIARLAWRTDRRAFAVLVTAQLVAGLAAGTVFVTCQRLMAAVLATGPVGHRLPALLPAAAVLIAAAAVRGLATAAAASLAGRIGPRMARLAQTALLERVVEVELITIEDSTFQNLVASARRGAAATQRVMDRVVGIGNAVLLLVAATGSVALLNPAVLSVLVLMVAPHVWGAAHTAGARFAVTKRRTELTRHLDQLAMLMTNRASAEELRVHGLGGFLLRHYARLAGAAEDEQAGLARREARVHLAAGTMSGLAGVLGYGALVYFVATGALDAAVAATAALAIRAGSASVQALVLQFRQLYEDALHVEDWSQACDRASTAAMASGARPIGEAPGAIEVDRVSFRYPGATRSALSDVNIHIGRGEVVALVGENGSGKSTLVKVLTGLYLPQSGVVRWDGTPTTALDRSSTFERISLLTQDFVQWPFTARMNVAIGRATGQPDPGRLTAAAAAAGAAPVVDGLADGWDTLLARDFWGGVNLSGGQWQRMALARIAYRDAPVVVADEPTAALDPAAEIATFDHLRSLARRGRSVVLITHRLVSITRVDRIYLLHRGRVVEAGDHDTLLAANGRYAAMYRAQADQHASGAAPHDRLDPVHG